MSLNPTSSKPASIDHVMAGASPSFSPSSHRDKGISLDDPDYKNMDPAAALQAAFKKENPTLNFDTSLQNFKLEKGFRAPGSDKNTPIPLYAYSNPPGPNCYCLVRHWEVAYKNAAGQTETLHFTKTIYTSVQIPSKQDGNHEQQQYIAALAARTYAKVEESILLKTATGRPDDMYEHISSHISKIARDRFITLEMFNGDKNVAINPKNAKDIKDTTVTSLRLYMRPGNKKDPAVSEAANDANPIIRLADTALNGRNPVKELKEKPYRLMAENDSPPEIKELSAILGKDELLEAVKNMSPKKAFESVGVSPENYKDMESKKYQKEVSHFYNHVALFGDKKGIPKLINENGQRGKRNRPLMPSEATINRLPPFTKTGFGALFNRNEKKDPYDLAVIAHMKNMQPSKELMYILAAYENAHEELLKKNEEIKSIESNFRELGFTVKPEGAIERQKILDIMREHIEDVRENFGGKRGDKIQLDESSEESPGQQFSLSGVESEDEALNLPPLPPNPQAQQARPPAAQPRPVAPQQAAPSPVAQQQAAPLKVPPPAPFIFPNPPFKPQDVVVESDTESL